MLKWPDKDPDEIADYMIDWTNRLDGDTIATASWVVPSGITEDSAVNDATTATIWLSGGTAGSTYILLSRVVTAGARTLEEAIALKVSATV